MTTIHSFNVNNNHHIAKIHIKYQLDDLKTKVACHVIDFKPSYNILLEHL